MKKRKARRISAWPPKKRNLIEEIKSSMSAKREKYLMKLIKRLTQLETDAFRPRHGRFDFYAYLEEILKVYWAWEDEEARKTRRDQLGALAVPVIKPRKGRTTLHVLVLATSQQKLEVKNRWIQALRFAAKKRQAVKKVGLASFVHEHGGISGCAQKAVRNKRPVKSADNDDWGDD